MPYNFTENSQPLAYQPWYTPNEPNGELRENHVASGGLDKHGKWVDFQDISYYRHPFICQKDIE